MVRSEILTLSELAFMIALGIAYANKKYVITSNQILKSQQKST